MEIKILVILLFYGCFNSMFIEVSTAVGKQRNRKTTCYVEVSYSANKMCRNVRAQELERKRKFYRMSGPGDFNPFPHLNQPVREALGYFSRDHLHSEWYYLYFKKLGKSKENVANAMKLKYARSVFSSFDDYSKLIKDFRYTIMKEIADPIHFNYASNSYRYFVKLEKDKKFMEDYYFAQLRLAGLNPMAIKKVSLEGNSGTNYGDLLTRLNLEFDWNNAITAITEDDWIGESIEKNKVYVVEYPALNGVKQMPDLLAKYNPGRTMKNNTAPIALFAVDRKRRLRPVAIQNKPTKVGRVYTPQNGIQWTIAKAELQETDSFYSSLIEHLLKTHFKMEPVCISMHRHLSKLHPLHQILQYHCRGLIPVNIYGNAALLQSNFTIRPLFSYGTEGARQLMLREYDKMVWNDIDLEVNLKNRGMNDRRQIPYYPYRDDGRLANLVLQRFANRLIRQYYKSDKNVRRDSELQNMIGELAQRKGTKHANKISKVKGLPSRFLSRLQLSNFVRQALWIVVQHSVFSYSTADFGSMLIYPTKLYDSQKRAKNLDLTQMLPGPIGTMFLETLLSGIGTYRYDVMFDYWKHLKSKILRRLVMRAYKEMLVVQRLIHRRNRRRYLKGQLTNPFMMREWLPNSICT